MARRVAIFLDHENLYISWQRKTGKRKITPAVIDAVAAQYGPAVVRRAYDNWGVDRVNARNQFNASGYECVDVGSHRVEDGGARSSGWRRKNMADVALVSDLLLAASRDYADVFVIGSGDGTFTYPAAKLDNPLGKRAVFLGIAGNISRLIYDGGYDVHHYDDWLDHAEMPPAPPPPDPEDSYARDRDALLGLLAELRAAGVPSLRRLVDLFASELPCESLAALIERARIRGELVVEEGDGQQVLLLRDEVINDQRPAAPTTGVLHALLVVGVMHGQPDRPVKQWLTTLRERREGWPAAPSNRELQQILDELKNRGMLVEARHGRKPAQLHLSRKPLLRWLAERQAGRHAD